MSSLFATFLIFFYYAVKIKRLDSVPIGIESIILMVFIVGYFYFQFKNISAQNIYDTYSFWIVLGILIYIGFTFFFNILANNLNNEHFAKYYYYSYLGDILKNIFFSVAIIYIAKNSLKNESKNNSSLPYLDMI